jgi:N-acetylglutamate synthase-like GNAT family acetyltransferase
MLDGRSREEMEQMLSPLPQHDRDRLVRCMSAIEALLERKKEDESSIILREHRPGDMGWVLERHAALYHEQDGWGPSFEALCAGIVKHFLEHFDPKRERCWIAEQGGQRLGCVFLVKDAKTIARLRLLLVEPSARGAGLGRRLVEECIAFAREKGYRKLVLWTHAHLGAARAIYRKTGFRKLPKTEAHTSFGPRAVSEYWELEL